MTPITKPVIRETAVVYRRKPLVVELRPGYLLIRHKGKRVGVAVDYAAIYELGYKMAALEAAQLKRIRG